MELKEHQIRVINDFESYLDTVFSALGKRAPRRPKLVVWLVPSLTILDQTVQALNHPVLGRSSSGTISSSARMANKSSRSGNLGKAVAKRNRYRLRQPIRSHW